MDNDLILCFIIYDSLHLVIKKITTTKRKHSSTFNWLQMNKTQALSANWQVKTRNIEGEPKGLPL